MNSQAKNIIIRELKKADLTEVRAIFRQFVQHHVQYDYMFKKIAEADLMWGNYIIDSQKQNENFKALVADLNGEVVGYCIGFIHEKPPIYEKKLIGEVSNIAVKKGFKRCGIGHQLFDSIKDWFKEHKVDHIETEVATSNPQSMGFWSKVGGREFIKRMEIKI